MSICISKFNKETGDWREYRRQETEYRRQETGDRIQETEYRRQERKQESRRDWRKTQRV